MELLHKLYNISSPSRKEDKMIRFITSWLQKRNIRYYVDKLGNIFVTKGKSSTYPCIVAHTDEVHRDHPKDFTVVKTGEEMLFGFSPMRKDFVGIGADDKNGIWVCLKCLEEFDVLKCAFFVSEEIGCIGSGKADMKFFDNCRYVLQCDRKGSSDLITKASNTALCSSEFIDAVKPKKFRYKQECGAMTDVLILKQRGLKVSCVNISCGYYHPHSSTEFTIISDLINCLEFVRNIVRTCTKTYPHKYQEPINTFSRSYGFNNYTSRHQMIPVECDDFDANWGRNMKSSSSYQREIEYETALFYMSDLLSINLNYPFNQLVDECKENCDLENLRSSDFTSIYEEIMGCPPPKPSTKIKEVTV